MDFWVWAVLLLVVGILLLILDIFLPSGGVLATLSALSVIISVGLGFMSGPGVGIGIMISAAILVPAIIAMAVQFWPQTPLGRLILIQRPEHPDDVLPDTDEFRSLRNLIGKQGNAKCLMLPSGIVDIEHHHYDAVSEGIPIEIGQPVEVIAVRTNRLVVRPLSANQALQRSADDMLSRPIETLGLESLEDPLA